MPYHRGVKSDTEPWIVAHNVILSHANAVALYRQKYQSQRGGRIGITLNGEHAEPYDESPESGCRMWPS
jgi:beta-glucosidase